MLCRVKLLEVSKEDLEVIKSFFFDPLEEVETGEDWVRLRYMGGEQCGGRNDFGEGCGECRYMPWVVRKYLREGKYSLK
ncbi:hypothetical protein [Candidatus Pyrohabitans sp.]